MKNEGLLDEERLLMRDETERKCSSRHIKRGRKSSDSVGNEELDVEME